MTSNREENNSGALEFFSSVKNDAWCGRKSGSEYEWWYFDALSDDGDEVISIVFLDNCVFSPAYNLRCGRNGAAEVDEEPSSTPAVAFTYHRDGKPVYRSICEYSEAEFEASDEVTICRIGSNKFEYKKASYGTGFFVQIDLPLSRRRRLTAEFEWLSIESNLAAPSGSEAGKHRWNLVSPRSDVTGKISIVDRRGKTTKQKFRGTGYHDHRSDDRWMPDAIEEWYWGRAHFPHTTAVYYRLLEKGNPDPVSRLMLVRDNKLIEYDCEFEFDGSTKTSRFGLSSPARFTIKADEITLNVENTVVIDSSFFCIRFRSDISLDYNGQIEEASGVSEYVLPGPLKNKWLNRLLALRIGRNGKSALIP
ncbi:MAG: hypothetical protein HKN33_10920 [Pyrinomonadaceae bacterium]|nr:hypothetical protein [Pyrinomonadaceae bacterium]